MDVEINFIQRDCSSLIKTTDRNREAMNEAGFSEEDYQALVGANNDLLIKETAQQKAAKNMEDSTALLDQAISETQKLISDVKFAAKSAYENDPRNMNMFNIGADVPKSVGKLIPQGNYFSEIVQERKDVLLKSGLTQAKIDALALAPKKLSDLDDAQEEAKKVKKTATMVRNKAAELLKKKMTKVRNFAKSCFSGKPEILTQFDPIPKGHGGGGGEDEQPSEQPKG